MHAMQLEVVGDSDTSADKVLSQIEDAIKKDEIKLPAMPDIAMKIRDAFKDEQEADLILRQNARRVFHLT